MIEYHFYAGLRPSELSFVAEKIVRCDLNNIATVFGCSQYDETFDKEKLINKILLDWDKNLINIEDEPPARYILVKKLIELKQRTLQEHLSGKEFEKIIKEIDIYGNS